MGCDIHSHVEVRRDGRWVYESGEEYTDKDVIEGPFGWRDYGLYGFLADVRNHSHSPVIAEPRGVPGDLSPEARHEYNEWLDDLHHASWLTVAELLAYDYDQVFWDRRVTKQLASGVLDGAALADQGEGRHISLRQFLGNSFFADLVALQSLGKPEDVRVVFWFDN
jgi:hypothetical protein